MSTGTTDYSWPVVTKSMEAAVMSQLKESISIYDRSGSIAQLEDRFREYYGCKYAVATNAGTTALWSLYVGSGIGPGDEVICPTYTFFATASPIFFTGAVPVLTDCDESGNIDPREIARHITPRTKAIVVTHMWGVPCDMASICALASEHGLALLEDGSHAHGARQGGRLVGTFGQGSAFSLQAQKLITGGEGGIVLTDNEEVFYRALMLGHFNKRCRQEIPQEHPLYQFAITGMGMKLRAHPLAAAIAVEQFSHLDVWIANKCKNVAILTETLAGIPGLELPRVANDSVPSWYAYNLRFTSEMTERHSVAFLHERLIAAGCTEIDRASSTRPLHLLPLFQNPAVLFPNYGANGVSYKPGDFPVSEALYETTLKLPVWCMDGDESTVYRYAQTIKRVLGGL